MRGSSTNLAVEQVKTGSLKSRLAQTLRQPNIFNQEKKQQLTNKELKELRKINARRELYNLLDRTQSHNNHLKYLQKPRLLSAFGSGALRQSS